MASSTATASQVASAINDYLTSKHLPPIPSWLQTFMPSIRLNTPIQALQKTALFRLLSSDITTSLQPTTNTTFPANISSPETKDRKLLGPIPVQILDIEDIGHSRWSQVEHIEAHEKGEMTKGREIIRVVDDLESNTDTSTPAPPASSGPHKLLLQDAKGTKVYGLELVTVPGLSAQQTAIGCKMVLRDVTIARGLVLLEPKGVEVLGGKVEVWDKQWRGGRKEVLKRKAGTNEGG